VFSSVANITFAPAPTISNANIALWWYPLDYGVAGWHESPDTDNPSHQRWGIFNGFFSDVWAQTKFGGAGRATMIQEIAIGLGLVHPYDGGGRDDATTFPGVGETGGLGDNGLNQSIYTVLSNNNGLNTAPDGGLRYGHRGGLGAFDIAALQALYCANMTTATGNDVYALPTKNDRGTGWMSIWDAGGIDTISSAASKTGVTIDLRAATLAPNDPGAGGYISQQKGIAGGFTIAKGVVIENAVGSAYDDVLIGNSAANVLDGGAGNDTYYLDSPSDVVVDSGGNDTVYATFKFSNPAIENVFVNGVKVVSGGAPLEGGFRILHGGSGRDVLTGSEASEKIYGGLGKDMLSGGAGQDIFVFDTRPNKKTNLDVVTDYSVADDTIWLDNKYLKKLGKGSESKPQALNRKFFALDKAKDGNDYLVYVKKTGALYYDEDGSGAKAAVQIATLPKKLAGFSAGGSSSSESMVVPVRTRPSAASGRTCRRPERTTPRTSWLVLP
jgi:serralysin